VDLTVRVDPTEVTLAAGQEATVTVTVANSADNVEHYGVHLSGLPEGCAVSTTPELTKLHPGASGQIEVRLTADELRPPLAGRGVVGVTAASPYRPQVTRTAELVLEVLPAPALLMSVTPEVVSGGDRDVGLELTNTGNTTLDVALGGRDSEGKVRLTFAPPAVRLAARATARADLHLRARRPLSGTDVRRQVTVVASSDADEQQRLVTLVQRPWVPGGVTRLVAAGTGVAVLAAAVITAAVLVAGPGGNPSPAGSTSSSTQAVGPTTSGGSTTASGGSSTSSSGSSSSSSSSSGGSSTSTAGQPGQPLTIDLTQPPTGQPTVNQRLTPAAYGGVVLSIVPGGASEACAGHQVVSFMTLDGGRTAVLPGDFGTATDGTPEGLCNDLPLEIELSSGAASAVSVTFIALPAPGSAPTHFDYVLQGAPDHVVSEQATSVGQQVTLTVQSNGPGGIRSLQLTGNPPNSGIVAALTQITVTPRPSS
jgi:hypothetical protein